MEMNKELAAKAKTVEELIAIAKENGIELTEADANKYFEQLHSEDNGVSDDELETVSGGANLKPFIKFTKTDSSKF